MLTKMVLFTTEGSETALAVVGLEPSVLKGARAVVMLSDKAWSLPGMISRRIAPYWQSRRSGASLSYDAGIALMPKSFGTMKKECQLQCKAIIRHTCVGCMSSERPRVGPNVC